MASVVNFDQLPTGQVFNINLDLFGNLNFNANGQNGGGSTRLAISDDSGHLFIRGSSIFRELQLKVLLMATQDIY